MPSPREMHSKLELRGSLAQELRRFSAEMRQWVERVRAKNPQVFERAAADAEKERNR